MYMMLLRFTFDCTAPQSPQIGQSSWATSASKVNFSKSVFRFYLQCHDFPLQCFVFTHWLLQRGQRRAEMSSRSECVSHLTCKVFGMTARWKLNLASPHTSLFCTLCKVYYLLIRCCFCLYRHSQRVRLDLVLFEFGDC